MNKKKFTRLRRIPQNQQAVVFEEVQTQNVIPYDENLLERARIQWQFGDWSKLACLERDTLQHHPERAKLALLAAAGRLQTGDAENARSFVRLAKDWGCSKQLISQILVSGAHNSLGRAAALTSNHGWAIQHFEKAIAIGLPSGDQKLISQARMLQKLNENKQYAGVIQYTEPNEALFNLYSAHSGYVSDKWDLYLRVYESIFSSHRNRKISLLEIGIQNGGSLEIWEKYFKSAKIIVGCDIEKKCAELIYESSKVKLAIGDVNEKTTQNLIFSYSRKYDIIIDDGSHRSSDIVNAFCALFSSLSLGGIYVVEDLHCSYWKGWEGGLNETKSAISFFKLLVDMLNHEHWEPEMQRRQILMESCFDFVDEKVLGEIHSIRFYNSMCVIEKKQEKENTLGVRHVVGFNETVCNVKQLDGTFM